MAETYKDKIHLYVVYLREAHPDDGWQVEQNRKDKIVLNDPKTLEEREKVARGFVKDFKLKHPVLIDTMDDATNKAYAGWPDRLYVIDKDGKIAYQGGPGPGGFKPAELGPVLEKLVGKK